MTRYLTMGIPFLLLGCDAPAPPLDGAELITSSLDPLLRQPPLYAGCSDAHFFASNVADTVGLTVDITGLASEALNAGQLVTYEYTVPTAGVDATLELGQNITAWECNDVILPGSQPMVMHALQLVSGTITASAVPEPGATAFMPFATADILIEDAVFEAPGGQQLSAPLIEMYDVYIGWLAG